MRCSRRAFGSSSCRTRMARSPRMAYAVLTYEEHQNLLQAFEPLKRLPVSSTRRGPARRGGAAGSNLARFRARKYSVRVESSSPSSSSHVSELEMPRLGPKDSGDVPPPHNECRACDLLSLCWGLPCSAIPEDTKSSGLARFYMESEAAGQRPYQTMVVIDCRCHKKDTKRSFCGCHWLRRGSMPSRSIPGSLLHRKSSPDVASRGSQPWTP